MAVELTGRQKKTIVVSILYLITLFTFTHIPIPQVVYQARVSDKWLHFLAYMNLFFLLWFSISPDKKANWRKPALWLIFLGAIICGGVDELSQPYTGRTCDVLDFVADAEGIFAGLVIFTFLPFWPSLLVVWAISIFGVATLISADLSKVAPILDAVYHVLAYAGLTLIWTQLMNLYLSSRTIINRLLLIMSLPLGLMFFVKVLSMLLGRYFTTAEMLFSGSAITVAAIATCLSVRKGYQEPFRAKGV
ncbi:MAG: VanZ family protein [Sedimentisphaerales bacterium]